MKISWCTDVHLDHAPEARIVGWLTKLREQAADAIIITGDITNCKLLRSHLELIDKNVVVPTYFVLGNHDAYGGSIRQIREIAREVTKTSNHLVWLSGAETIRLTERTALVGHDGWPDTRSGCYEMSEVRLADFRLIEEFLDQDKNGRRDRMMKLADEAGTHLLNVLPGDEYQQVVVATHVAPFPEAATYAGKISDASFQPFFCNLGLGKDLVAHAANHPNQKMVVLCGHSHGRADLQPLPNIEVLSGEAEYGYPSVEAILEIP